MTRIQFAAFSFSLAWLKTSSREWRKQSGDALTIDEIQPDGPTPDPCFGVQPAFNWAIRVCSEALASPKSIRVLSL